MPLDMRFDSRLLERNLNKGLITKKEYEDHLAKLADAAEKAEPVKVKQPEAPRSLKRYD